VKYKNLEKLQKEWGNCTKAANTNQYFPHVQERLKIKINVYPVLAVMVTGRGKPRLTLI
jgi:hypothetical protein